MTSELKQAIAVVKIWYSQRISAVTTNVVFYSLSYLAVVQCLLWFLSRKKALFTKIQRENTVSFETSKNDNLSVAEDSTLKH